MFYKEELQYFENLHPENPIVNQPWRTVPVGKGPGVYSGVYPGAQDYKVTKFQLQRMERETSLGSITKTVTTEGGGMTLGSRLGSISEDLAGPVGWGVAVYQVWFPPNSWVYDSYDRKSTTSAEWHEKHYWSHIPPSWRAFGARVASYVPYLNPSDPAFGSLWGNYICKKAKPYLDNAFNGKVQRGW